VHQGDRTMRQQHKRIAMTSLQRCAYLLVTLFITLACGATAFAQQRMPPIADDQQTEAQRKVVADVVSGPRGRLSPPFVPLLRSPELLSRMQRVGEYLIYHNSLNPRIFELSVLLVARHWTQQFEWRYHYPLALKAGVKQESIDAIAEGRRPAALTDDETIAYDFVTELLVNRSVSDASYARLRDKFGEQSLIDLVGSVGFYTSIAMVANVDRTPIPDNTIPLLKPLP
jgi:4-carboxymuconolactone decarboxylase